MKMFPFIKKNFIVIFRLGPTIWPDRVDVGLLRDAAVHTGLSAEAFCRVRRPYAPEGLGGVGMPTGRP